MIARSLGEEETVRVEGIEGEQPLAQMHQALRYPDLPRIKPGAPTRSTHRIISVQMLNGLVVGDSTLLARCP